MTDKDLDRFEFLTAWTNDQEWYLKSNEKEEYGVDTERPTKQHDAEMKSLKSKLEERLLHTDCSMYYCVKNEDLESQVAKLKEERDGLSSAYYYGCREHDKQIDIIETLREEIAKLKEELLNKYENDFKLKATLDEINAMTNNSYATTQQKIEAIQKTLAKHEGKSKIQLNDDSMYSPLSKHEDKKPTKIGGEINDKTLF